MMDMYSGPPRRPGAGSHQTAVRREDHIGEVECGTANRGARTQMMKLEDAPRTQELCQRRSKRKEYTGPSGASEGWWVSSQPLQDF